MQTPTFWNLTITCFEPLKAVTGGIGTYTRLLLTLIDGWFSARRLRVLFICSREPDVEVQRLFPNITFAVAPADDRLNGIELQYLGNEHFRFSFAVSRLLRDMYLKGHRFCTIEFPDYGVEGFYTIKLRRQGMFACDQVAVRLHSPSTMLIEDNQTPLHHYSTHCRHVIKSEMYVYEHADRFLYGADAMLERVRSICGRFGIDIGERATKIPHPHGILGNGGSDVPPIVAGPSTSSMTCGLSGILPSAGPIAPDAIRIGFLGRLEIRKGIARFFESIFSNPDAVDLIKQKNLVFVLAGRDLDTHEGETVGAVALKCAIPEGCASRIIMLGNLAQDEVQHRFLPEMDAFVFPSLFENYPNALLETLPFGRPTLVSVHGGMPEVSAPFPHVSKYDPASPEGIEAVVRFFAALQPRSENRALQAEGLYREIAKARNGQLVKAYIELVEGVKAVRPTARSVRRPSVSFIITFFNDAQYIRDCLQSVATCVRAGDEILIVDDHSRSDEAAMLATVAAKYGARVHRQMANQGPAVARNTGVGVTSGEFIQFLDADDMLEAEGFRHTRDALSALSELDMVYGMQRAFGEQEHYWMPRDCTVLNVLEENFAHSAVLIRRAVFEKLGGYSMHLRHHFEDWEFNGRFALSGFRSEVVPYVTQVYRVRQGSRSFANPTRLALSRQQCLGSSVLNAIPTGNVPDFERKLALGIYAAKQLSPALSGPRSTISKRELAAQFVYLSDSLRRSSVPEIRRVLARLFVSISKRVARVSVVR